MDKRLQRHYQKEAAAQNGRLFQQLESFLIQHWWLIFFALFCLVAYYSGLKRFHEDETFLKERKEQLLLEKEAALDLRQQQVLQIESENDPAWVELVLMKRLGVIPEGQQKVYFSSKRDHD